MIRIFSWKQIRVVLAVFALLAIVLVPSVVNGTVAGWNAIESSEGEFQAGTVPAPLLTKECAYKLGVPILGRPTRVEIYWRLPDGYDLEDVELEAATDGLGSALAPLTGYNLSLNTTSTGGGNYTTMVPAGLLTGLLGSFSELKVVLYVNDSSGWQSAPAAIASNAGLLGSGTCRNLTDTVS